MQYYIVRIDGRLITKVISGPHTKEEAERKLIRGRTYYARTIITQQEYESLNVTRKMASR